MQLSYYNDKKRMLVILSLMFIKLSCVESFILYYFGGARSKAFATLRNVPKLLFGGQD